MLLPLLVVKLVRRVFQTVVKTVTRSAVGHLGLKSLLQLAGGNLGNTGGEDNVFPFLYINWSEISLILFLSSSDNAGSESLVKVWP